MILNTLTRWNQFLLLASIFLMVNLSFYFNDREHVTTRLINNKDFINQLLSIRVQQLSSVGVKEKPGTNFLIETVDIPKADGTSYQFLIGNTHLCDQTRPWLLIWVYSAIKNSAHRDAIRKTWGQSKEYLPAKVSIVFSLALSSTASDQTKIENEQRKYGDLVQDGTFIDDYQNLTYKAIGMLHWTSTFCPEKKMLLKTDDDTLIIPYRLGRWLNEFQQTNTWPNNSMACATASSARVIRNEEHKWYVSPEEFPEEIFGELTCPTSYFISQSALLKLAKIVNQVRFLWLEDMFISGVVAGAANLSYINISSHIQTAFLKKDMENNRDVYVNPQRQSYFILGHLPGVKTLYRCWNTFDALRQNKGHCIWMNLPNSLCMVGSRKSASKKVN